ncbi:MAG: sodium-dependent transporter [Pirellulaceae bacterium]|nr:sodium-dependent transporter [Pirellulaceae bacterium]
MAKERWASRLGLVLAMAGNAVGLGNFLRFPAQAVQNGGGAFLIPYFVALAVMGLPLIWVEWAMGRYGGKFGHHSTPGIFQSMGRSPVWKYLGVFGLWTNLIIASYYLYIESWTMAYAGYSLIGGFNANSSVEFLKQSPPDFFARLTGEAPNQIFAISAWGLGIFFLCMAINVFILSRGLAKGIELVSKIGMPVLIIFAIILAIRGLMIVPESEAAAGGWGIVDKQAVASPFEGLNFVWNPKFDSLTNPAVWLAAAGQIFFTLSIGMGSIHCYASYVREKDDIALTGATAAWTNEFCEVILGGTILIPIAVAYLGLAEVQQKSGFGLGFMVFPTLFQKWGMLAPAAGFMWFGLLFFAAITSSLAMGQPIMAFLQTEFGFSRGKSALAFGAMLFPLAFPVACLSQKTFFDEFDYWAGTFALVLFAVIETILFAWVFGMDRGWEEMLKGAELKIPRAFYYIIKYVTPVFLLVILVAYTFQPEGRVPVRDSVTRAVLKDPVTGEERMANKGWEPYILAPFSGEPAPAWKWSGDGMIGKLVFADVPIPDGPPAAAEFARHVRLGRTGDRLVMVGAFIAFSLLVALAWRKRRAQGEPA